MEWLKKLFGGTAGSRRAEQAAAEAARLTKHGPRRGLAELAQRLGMTEAALRAVRAEYQTYSVPKRSGGTRTIDAPSDSIKRIQRAIDRRVVGRTPVHAAATGFEPGHSIVGNAQPHTRKAVVVRFDIKDFFASTRASRVHDFFTSMGWAIEAADELTRLCIYRDGLPQGAPTSPRIANRICARMDRALTTLGASVGAVYTRYADDLTFSFELDDSMALRRLLGAVPAIVNSHGYRLNWKKGPRVMRRHHRQTVTGLVVNEGVRLTRTRRRWLRAIEHHQRTGRAATLTPAQLSGWRAFADDVEGRADSGD